MGLPYTLMDNRFSQAIGLPVSCLWDTVKFAGLFLCLLRPQVLFSWVTGVLYLGPKLNFFFLLFQQLLHLCFFGPGLR